VPTHNQLPIVGNRVIDPANHRMGVLPIDPGFDRPVLQPTPTAAGLWFAGTSGDPLWAGVSVSHDGGATWIRGHLLAATPPAGVSGIGTHWYPEVATRDGQRAYALARELPTDLGDAGLATPRSPSPTRTWVFLTTDGGVTWAPTSPAPVLGDFTQVWATSDGHLVVCSSSTVDSCKISADGVHVADAVLSGLPGTAVSTDGSTAMTDHAMYSSDDGVTWHEVWHD
jgi:hypothetical protein